MSNVVVVSKPCFYTVDVILNKLNDFLQGVSREKFLIFLSSDQSNSRQQYTSLAAYKKPKERWKLLGRKITFKEHPVFWNKNATHLRIFRWNDCGGLVKWILTIKTSTQECPALFFSFFLLLQTICPVGNLQLARWDSIVYIYNRLFRSPPPLTF